MWAKILNYFKNVVALSSGMQSREAIKVEDHWWSGAVIWITDFSYLGSICAVKYIFCLSRQNAVWSLLKLKELYLDHQVKKTFSKQKSRDMGKEETKFI